MMHDHESGEFCEHLTAVANALEAGDTLRFLARRRAPLTRTLEELGHLDVLLRFSCRSEGQGFAVLVFEWPTNAMGHSVITVLNRWKQRCVEGETHEEGRVSVRWRSVVLDEKSAPGIHLNVVFPVCHVPTAVHELIEIAVRIGVTSEANATLCRKLEELGEASPPRVDANGVSVRNLERKNGMNRASIDLIAPNDEYDKAVHPKVRLNEQVQNSRGEIFRLVLKRVHGHHQQVWIKIPGVARRHDQ